MGERGAIGSLDDFKARLPLADILGRYLRLTRRGRELVGLCPFHKERTPSFTVVEDKGFYHCFGCGAHGNAIDFVMAKEGLDFAEALARLAELTGIPAPRLRAAEAPVDKGLYAANEAAARWFQGKLQAGIGADARSYLEGRGLDAATIPSFGLGFAPPSRDALKRALGAEGYGEDLLVEAGLLTRPEDGAPYDRFRGRIMFPIHDRQGRVVGFGGRALGDAEPKYLNTPDTPLFHKRELLYGLARARRAAREAGTVIVAEGYLDVIALDRAGHVNAVAPLGTAISEEQLLLLWQLADEPILCLDGDEAGLRAAHRLAERALAHLRAGKSLRFAILPAGEDPDSLLRARGKAALARCLEDAVPLIDFLWVRESAGRNLSTPERQAALHKRLRELARAIPERRLARLFQDAMEARFRARFQAPGGRARRATPPWAPSPRPSISLPDQHARERRLLAPLLVHPELLVEVEEPLAELEIADPALDALRQELIAWHACNGSLDPDAVRTHLTASGYGELVDRLRNDRLAVLRGRRSAGAAELLSRWHADAAEQRASAARRGEAEEVARAVEAVDEGELRAHLLRIDRLINRASGAAGAEGDAAAEHRRDLERLETELARLGRVGTRPGPATEGENGLDERDTRESTRRRP